MVRAGLGRAVLLDAVPRIVHTLILLSAIALWPHTASADVERLRTTTKTTMHASPGESAPKVRNLKKGRKVLVLERRGRWVKVRAGRKTGWVTRTSLQRPKPKRETKPSKSRWGSGELAQRSDMDRKFAVDDPPTVTVVADRAQLFARPGAKAQVVQEVESDQVLTVGGQSDGGRWLLVQTRDGATGWIIAAAVSETGPIDPAEPDASPVVVTRSKRRTRADLTATGGPKPLAPTPVDHILMADLGFRSLGMAYSSDGQTGLGSYNIAAQSASVGVGVQLRDDLGIDNVLVGVDARYRVGRSSPGIHYESDSTGAVDDIPFTTHELELGALIGYETSVLGGMFVAGRAGFHYDVFLVGDIYNAGMLANESLTGITLGARIELPRLDDSLSMAAGFDLLVAADRSQTNGLEDGQTATAGASWFDLGMSYAIATKLTLTGAYRYGRAQTTWTGGANRMPGVTAAERTDSSHQLIVGLGRSF